MKQEIEAIKNILLTHEKDLLLSALAAQEQNDVHVQKFYEREANKIKGVLEKIKENNR